MIRRQNAGLGKVRLLRGALLLAMAPGVYAQAPAKTPLCAPADSAKTSEAKPCAAAPSAVQRFPYPGEGSQAKEPDTLDAPSATPGSKAVKDQFPYPGEASAPAEPAPAAGESSSSSSADALPPDVDGKPALKDEGTAGSTARGRRRLRPPAQKILSDEERVEEDLSVAHFYQQSGNLNGAYLRVKDAVKVQPQAPDAHLALAEVAQKLGKRDEAVAEYTKYLELDPDGVGVKAAKRSLERLKP